MKQRFIALVGASATGKSTVERILQEEHGYNRCVSHTTRPKRNYEVDGIDYHFVTLNQFLLMENERMFAESTCFNQWWYGLTKREVAEGGVVVINPSGLQQIIENVGRENVTVIYITCSDKERLIRSLSTRGDNDVEEVIRRYHADKRDMMGMEKVADLIVENTNVEDTLRTILEFLEVRQ